MDWIASAPSNIAFQKYWGKADVNTQWPANDSLSMTLSQARTESVAKVIDGPDHVVELNGQRIDREQDRKIFLTLDYLLQEWGETGKIKLRTRNLFPSNCGLASSASGFAALTLASLAAFDSQKAQTLLSSLSGRQALANWSRMGSGSSVRSFFGGYVLWDRGASPDQQSYQSLYEKDYWCLMDTVVLFSTAPKPVSSSKAHLYAQRSPLFKPRIAGLHERLLGLREALESRSIKTLGRLIEEEALEMHAVMMTASPAVQFIHDGVSRFLAWIREARQKMGLEVYFTMDAGPNVHLIYEPLHQDALAKAIADHFPGLELFHDRVGSGPFMRPCEPEEWLDGF